MSAAASFGGVFTVTKSADTTDGVCDSDCSLREAVAAAIASPETDDVIVFSSALSDAPLDIRLGEIAIPGGNSAFSENGAPAGAAFNCDNNFGNNTGMVTFINTTFDNANPNNLQFRDGTLQSTCFTSLFNSTLTTTVSFGTQVLFLRNTIAGRISAATGGVASEGSNIIGSAVGYTPSANDRVGVNPALGPFQLNGGHVPTYALQAGSPAIDAGNNASATNPAFDARGFFRIVDGNGDKDPVIDIGAYEYLSTHPAPANVSLSGQVYNQTTGTPYFRASVTVVDSHGVSRQGLTNSFGYYTIPNIPSDEYCAVIVSAKKGRFVMQAVNSEMGINDLNFISN
jgi:CSLREA domain-containing protein